MMDLRIVRRAMRDGGAAAVNRGVVDAYHVALANPAEHVRPHGVEQGDTGRDDDLRPKVGVPAADAGLHVDDRRHLAGDERLCAEPVDVDVVDDRDVAGIQPLGEVPGAPVEPCDAGHPGQLRPPGAPQRR
jgi:hypothetical protein